MEKSSLQNIYFIDVYDSEVNENINTETLYNETIFNFKYINKNINHEFILINSKQEFIDTLKKIEIEIIENSFTLIHLSIHGSSELDGVISSNGELITWDEIKVYTRKINIKTKDKLFIVIASCFGKYIGEKVDLNNKSPFRAIIASKYEVYSSNIYSIFHEFYQSLLYENDIINSFNKIKDNQDIFFYSDTYDALKKAFEKFIKERETKLPTLYKEYLLETKESMCFEDYKIINNKTIPELLEMIKLKFII